MLHLACVTSPLRDHAIIPHSPQVKLRSSFLDGPFFIGTNSTNLFDRVGDDRKEERSDLNFTRRTERNEANNCVLKPTKTVKYNI